MFESPLISIITGLVLAGISAIGYLTYNEPKLGAKLAGYVYYTVCVILIIHLTYSMGRMQAFNASIDDLSTLKTNITVENHGEYTIGAMHKIRQHWEKEADDMQTVIGCYLLLGAIMYGMMNLAVMFDKHRREKAETSNIEA